MSINRVTKNMKILFVIPPQIVKSPDGVDARPSISIPLGVLYISAYLRKKGWQGEIKIYDARISAQSTKYQDGSIIFGDSWEIIARTICDYRPDVIAISNMFSWQINAAIALSNLCKKTCPDAITVLGGPHASSFPLDMIREPSINYVIMGEGEERFYQLLQALEKGKSISFQGILGNEDDANLLRPNKKAPIYFINDIDLVPIPAYDLVDVEKYFYLQSHGYSPRVREGGKRAVTILTSRGCPHQCIFCSVHSTMGYKFRAHSPAYIAAHINYLRKNYNIDYIHYEDDNLTHDIDRYEKILDIMLMQSPKIKWDTPNGVRADCWNYERVRRTKDSGCQYLCIAIESSVQRVIDEVVKKRLNLSKVEPVMRASQEVGLPLLAFYVLGLPGETAEEIRETVEYALDKYERYDVYPSFSMANPLHGTVLRDIVVENNLFHGATINDPPRPNTIKTKEFDTGYIQSMHDTANTKKAWITVKKMVTNPHSFLKYIGMSVRNPWFLKRIIHSTARSFSSKLLNLTQK